MQVVIFKADAIFIPWVANHSELKPQIKGYRCVIGLRSNKVAWEVPNNSARAFIFLARLVILSGGETFCGWVYTYGWRHWWCVGEEDIRARSQLKHAYQCNHHSPAVPLRTYSDPTLDLPEFRRIDWSLHASSIRACQSAPPTSARLRNALAFFLQPHASSF